MKFIDCLKPYSGAIGALSYAIGLYGTGDMNLHHRAAAHYWMSVAMEKLFGPAAALSSAEQSFELWKRQLGLDPANKHFEQNYENAMARVDELKKTPTH